ncbi:hypothetical protein V2J09_003129 [Rumex salicifolius]
MLKKKAQRNAAMEGLQWEMRPGGMIVQKRADSYNHHSNSNPNNNSTIKIRVKHNSSLHEIQINHHSSFGELKKMVEGPTEEQKLMFKEKERHSNQFLDIIGVKNGSSLVLMEDFKSQQTRLLENAAMKSVVEVTKEVDKLVGQVTKLERVIIKGGAVTEKELLNLTEMLMSLLIKLDGIVAIGHVKLQRKAQVIRVQRYIETLDKLKAQNGCTK